MAVRTIVKEGDPVLRTLAQDIDLADLKTEEFATLIEDMIETMYDAKGVGLAAPQIGLSKRIFVAESADGVIALINAHITKRSKKETKDEEGCLSIPGKFDKVKRAKKVTIDAVTTDGKPITFEAEGFFARIMQHEIDHLDGILYVDRVAEQKKPKKT